jgi:hypothetical protein
MSVYTVNGVSGSDGEVVKVLEPGQYPAEIVSSKFKTITGESEYAGAVILEMVIRLDGEELSTKARYSIWLPREGDDAEKVRKTVARLNRLQIACGLEPSDDIDDTEFMHAELIVEAGVKNDETYGKQNTVRDVLPR